LIDGRPFLLENLCGSGIVNRRRRRRRGEKTEN
jgi:hypothetical protein